MYEFSMTEEQQLLLESIDEFMERGDYAEYFKECDHAQKYPQMTTARPAITCWLCLKSTAEMIWISCPMS